MAYRILIWSTPQARIIDHDAVDSGETSDALERIAAAGRAALGLPPRGPDAQRRSHIARVHRHLARAKTLLEEL